MTIDPTAQYGEETFTTTELDRLFSKESRYQSWLDVEVALAQAEAEVGIILREAAEEITRKAKLENLNMDNIREGLARTGHGLVPLIWEFDRICEGDAGGYIHWGATTQNITQTGLILKIKEAHNIYLRDLKAILQAMSHLAETYKGAVMPGRTHGQHALPTTFGSKIAVWIDELLRHIERLKEAEKRVFVAMLGGGAGTLASLGEAGLEVQRRMGEKLGLGAMTIPARNIEDHLAEYVCLMGLLAATCGKFAKEMHNLMKPEFAEIEERVTPGAVGSSTMPHKRNPKLASRIISASAFIRSQVPLALEAMMIEHEAESAKSAITHHILSEVCKAMGSILYHSKLLFEGLNVFPEQMRRNLDILGGLITSEALMLKLGEKIGRQKAHDEVYEAAMAASEQRRPFKTLLLSSPEVAKHISEKEVDELLDPTRYTGLSELFAVRMAEKAREAVKAL